MAKHKINVTLTGSFEIDDNSLSDYQAETVAQALANQYRWLEDDGDVISFVADTIENPVLIMEIAK